MPWVATHLDLFRYFPAAAADPDARQVISIDVPTGTLEVPGHGFGGGELVRFIVRSGNVLPTGLAALTYYTVASVNGPDLFTISLGGSQVLPSDQGTGTIYSKENWLPKIDAIMSDVTSYLVASAIAYVAPWQTPPGWAPRIAAHLAAPDVAEALRIAENRYDVAGAKERAKTAEAFVEMLRGGMRAPDGAGPVAATTTPNDSARTTSAIAKGRVPSRWQRGTL